jgi:hypothetical protein
MVRTRMLSTALLLALLVAVLLSVPGEGEQAGAVEPRTVTARIMIPAAAFYDEAHDGDFLSVSWTNYTTVFLAPVEFPVQQVTVRGITMYAADRDSTASKICASLYRTRPAQGSNGTKVQSSVCTTENDADPQIVANRLRISDGAVNTAVNGSYLRVTFGPVIGGLKLYGVQITYAYQTP